jgi:uncharacterized membrane protein
MKESDLKTKRKFIRVDGRLRELITVYDKTGKLVQKIINPVMLEFYPRDIVQVIIGATILAIPLAFTEETWKLGEQLPLLNVGLIFLLSLTFISIFVYYNYYRNKIKDHWKEFLKRIISTYFLSFMVVSLILVFIQKASFNSNLLLSLKRIIIVTFPASMSAAIADIVK